METLEKPRTGPTHGMGAASVIVADGAVLLVKHNYGRHNWEIPGGVSEPGESAQATARREAREELDVELLVDGLTGVYWEPSWRTIGGHHFVFLAHLDRGVAPRIADSNEIAEFRWCSPDDLPRPISDFTVTRIRDAISGQRALFREVGSRRWFE